MVTVSRPALPWIKRLAPPLPLVDCTLTVSLPAPLLTVVRTARLETLALKTTWIVLPPLPPRTVRELRAKRLWVIYGGDNPIDEPRPTIKPLLMLKILPVVSPASSMIRLVAPEVLSIYTSAIRPCML